VLAAAQALGQQLILIDVTSSREIDAAFATFTQRQATALLIGGGAFLNSNRERIVSLAARNKLPAIFAWREAA
jgi:putative ABC transport system substrate-binding protein